ncbi:MAG: hypothetical protein H0U65_03210 [Rubrobacter sp.]|nr:hypothetical protein [Rubrobacter sp.]
MEPARVEAIESELDRIIEKRAKESKDANRTQELWKAAARVHNEGRRREHLAAWYDFHERMHDVHRGLAEEHAGKALALLGAGGDTT